jgi:hypothetical protein
MINNIYDKFWCPFQADNSSALGGFVKIRG